MKPFIDVEDNPFNVDQFHVASKDDEYKYVWANKKPENIEKMKAIWGWEVVGGKHQESALVPPNAAGERVNGDTILMRMPIKRWEKIQKFKDEKRNAQITAANEAWRADAERAGLLTEDTTKRTQSSSILGG